MLSGLHSYTLLQWLLLFYIYCFFGWCFESSYVSLRQHRFVNRGFVRLPLLPIYGSGALCILLTCLPYRGSVPAVFVLGIVFPTILEYVTGWAMEAMFKMRYWDYSTQKCNLKGYICLSSSLAWGFLSLLLIYVLHPPIGHLVQQLPPLFGALIAVPVTIMFLSDFAMAFRTAINLRHLLEELEHLRTQLDETRVQLELARAEARDLLEERRLQRQAELLRRSFSRRLAHLTRHYHIRAMLRAHPSAMSRQFSEPLRQAHDRAVAFRRQVLHAMEETAEDIRSSMEERMR